MSPIIRMSSQRYLPHYSAIRSKDSTQSACTATTGGDPPQGAVQSAGARLPGAKIGANSRLYDLEALPSTDKRFATADRDIRQHRGAVTGRAAVAGLWGAARRCRDRPRTPSAACASP